jgi:hypothetical protein
VELAREAVEFPEHRDLQRYLGTRDAHELYAKFGFESPTNAPWCAGVVRRSLIA